MPIIILIRTWEWILTHTQHDLPVQVAVFEALGLVTDLTTSWLLALVFLLPFILLCRLSRKLAITVFLVLVFVVTILQVSLVRFFLTTLVPLDQVILSYSLREILFITRSSAQMGFETWFPFVAALMILFGTQFLTRNWQVPRKLTYLVGLLLLLSPVYLLLFHPTQRSHAGDLDYFLQTSKTGYFLKKVLQHTRQPRTTVELDDAIRNYHRNHPEFSFTGSHYPLLYQWEPKDVLSPRFALNDRKPNLVFLIMESLSPTFCGPDPEAGRFMPFLDSLIVHSLYWENIISSSERTFYVLPALFGSLPFSNGIFLERVSRIPPHFSLINLLKEQGYHVSFFYAGDPAFNNMEQFLLREGTHFIQKGFPSTYQMTAVEHSGYSWGYPDGDLYRHSFGIIDSIGASPRLDIYLTLSLHAPFIVPDQQAYLKRFAEQLDQLTLTTDERKYYETYQVLFSTILYTDDALRQFFQEYGRRPEFANTIFVITGDHALPELSLSHQTPLEKFHVPLIIYSPMLTRPAVFPPVSSHLDVAPSLFAMLSNRYQIPAPEMNHWLGQGLDTQATFRNTGTIVPILNNKEIVDYVSGPYYLSSRRLFRLEPGLGLERIDDPRITAQLEQELKDYLTVTNAIGNQCEMVPEMLYFGSRMEKEVIPLTDSINLPGQINQWGYVSVLRNLPLSRDYRYLTVEIRFSFRSDPADSAKLPRLVMEVRDRDQKVFLWDMISLCCATVNPGDTSRWVRQHISRQIDVSFIDSLQKKTLKMYLWNEHQVLIRYDSLHREIIGFFEP